MCSHSPCPKISSCTVLTLIEMAPWWEVRWVTWALEVALGCYWPTDAWEGGSLAEFRPRLTVGNRNPHPPPPDHLKEIHTQMLESTSAKGEQYGEQQTGCMQIVSITNILFPFHKLRQSQ